MEEKAGEFQQRLGKLEGLRQRGVNPYPNDFAGKDTAKEVIGRCGGLDKDGLEARNETVRLAGRIMAFRDFGKASFLHIQDRTGRLQVYVRKDLIGEDAYSNFRSFDIGDIIGVEGKIFRTKTNELTIEAKFIRLLSKSLMSLPEKWHGLTDVEIRYRQRYLDLIVNPEVRDVFVKRTRIIQLIREFLNKMDFIEVETPMMQPIPGGAAAGPFITHHNALDIDLYLRIAPELYLKRLIIGGFEKVFEINRNFRNEGISYKHNPEFTMLEFYQAYADYNDMMDLTEKLLKFVASESIGKLTTSYRGNNIDFGAKWECISMLESIHKFGGIKVNFENSIKELEDKAKGMDIEIEKNSGKGNIINKIFEAVFDPKFIHPIFIKDYPIEISPLARRHPENENLTERFELFIGGEEIANAFSELIDPGEQLDRFKSQIKSNIEEERITGKIDIDFIKALEYGMPPTGGEGIGIDRLVMILTDSRSIRDVILFPLMKPE